MRDETAASKATAAPVSGPADEYRALMFLVECARWAPSADNNQPWEFGVDASRRKMTLAISPARARTQPDEQWLDLIGVGGAVENIVQAAGQNGWMTTVLIDTSRHQIEIDLLGQVSRNPPICDPAIAQRVTNRRTYDARPLDKAAIDTLRQASSIIDEISTYWIMDKSQIRQLAAVIARSDRLMFGDRRLRRSFFSHVQWDATTHDEVTQGLSPGSLELTGPPGALFRFLARRQDWVLDGLQFPRMISGHTRSLVRSSSGICMLTARDDSPLSDIAVGRAMQRAWLAMTRLGMAVQPLMSIVGHLRTLRLTPGCSTDAPETACLQTLNRDLRAALPDCQRDQPACFLRFGYARPPTARCGRLPTSTLFRQ